MATLLLLLADVKINMPWKHEVDVEHGMETMLAVLTSPITRLRSLRLSGGVLSPELRWRAEAWRLQWGSASAGER